MTDKVGESRRGCGVHVGQHTFKGDIDGFLGREVLPYAGDAWYQPNKVKIGYEISFNRYFYTPEPMRTLEEIRADILAVERETEGLLEGILSGLVAGQPRPVRGDA